MAEQLALTPCASLRRHLGLRLSWYQWMQSCMSYLIWSLCTWGVQVRPYISVWNKNNSVSKRNSPSLLLCCLTFSDRVVKKAICVKPTVPLGKNPSAGREDVNGGRPIGALCRYLGAWWRWTVIFTPGRPVSGEWSPVPVEWEVQWTLKLFWRCRRILYILYTSDLPTSRDTKMGTIADDTAIFATHADSMAASRNLQEHLNTVENWLKKNRK